MNNIKNITTLGHAMITDAVDGPHKVPVGQYTLTGEILQTELKLTDDSQMDILDSQQVIAYQLKKLKDQATKKGTDEVAS